MELELGQSRKHGMLTPWTAGRLFERLHCAANRMRRTVKHTYGAVERFEDARCHMSVFVKAVRVELHFGPVGICNCTAALISRLFHYIVSTWIPRTFTPAA
jgi:hypothetical protein